MLGLGIIWNTSVLGEPKPLFNLQGKLERLLVWHWIFKRLTIYFEISRWRNKGEWMDPKGKEHAVPSSFKTWKSMIVFLFKCAGKDKKFIFHTLSRQDGTTPDGRYTSKANIRHREGPMQWGFAGTHLTSDPPTELQHSTLKSGARGPFMEHLVSETSGSGTKLIYLVLRFVRLFVFCKDCWFETVELLGIG